VTGNRAIHSTGISFGVTWDCDCQTKKPIRVMPMDGVASILMAVAEMIVESAKLMKGEKGEKAND